MNKIEKFLDFIWEPVCIGLLVGFLIWISDILSRLPIGYWVFVSILVIRYLFKRINSLEDKLVDLIEKKHNIIIDEMFELKKH